MITVTMDQVREALKAAMETQGPDFVYSVGGTGSCFNVPLEEIRDEPDREMYLNETESDDPRRTTGCLVGTALRLLGVRPALLGGSGNYSASITTLADDLRHREAASFSDEQITYLSIAQRAQDCGDTWGKAIDHAEAWLSRRNA